MCVFLLAFSDDGEGVIDTVLSMEAGHDFVNVRLDPTLGEDGISTTQELIRCKKTVLTFYLNFLKVVRCSVVRCTPHNGTQT